MVDPSRTATSRSSVIPIDRSRTPSRSASDASEWNAARGVVRPALGSDAHQSAHDEPEILTTRDQIGDVIRPATTLLGFARSVHLYEHRGVVGALGDLGGELGSVDGLPKRDVFGDRPHLVRLQPTDEVPAHRGVRRCVERRHLLSQLLRVVLADVGQSHVNGRRDLFCREALRHRDDGDFRNVATRGGDAVSNPVETSCDGRVRAHGSVIQTTIA